MTLPIPVTAHPSEVRFRKDDVVILAMKTQDSCGAVAELYAAAGCAVAVVCAQNGVENERLALRRFERVYGMMVWMAATFLTPGEAAVYSAPQSGALFLGRYPAGTDTLAAELTELLAQSSFQVRCVSDVQRWKYGKLLLNLGNALEAACGPEADLTDIRQRLEAEALACFRAAGIRCASKQEMRELAATIKISPIAGHKRSGGSSWQSLSRGTGSIEADWLNGEVVLLGRLYGVPTPINARLQELAGRLALEHIHAGSLSAEGLRRLVLTQEGP